MGRRKTRRTRKLRGRLWLVLVALIASGYFLLRTESGLQTALSIGTSLASSDDLTIEIGHSSGAIASYFTLEDIRISDREGVWLTIDRARLDWRPSALLSGTFSADRIDVGHVTVARRPLPAPATATSDSGRSSGIPVGIAVDRFAIADLELAEPVAGAAARISADGSARLVDPAEGLRLTVDARRIDGGEGNLTARLGYVPDTGAIDARVSASEPAGGVVAGLLNIPGQPPMELLVDGTGKLDAGLITVALTAGGAGRLDATTRLARADKGIRVDLDARGELAELVPITYRRLVEGRTTLAARMVVDEAMSTITLSSAQLASAGLRAAVTGSIDLSGESNDIRFELTGGEADRFAELIPAPVRWGEVKASGQVTGALSSPSIVAKIDGTNWSYDTRQAGHVSADVALRPNGDALDIGADIRADGLALALPVDNLIGGTARLVVDATRRADGSADIRSFDIKGQSAQLSYTGTASAEAVNGTLAVSSPRVMLTADVEAANLRTSPSGTFSLNGTADGAPVTGRAAFAIEADGLRLDDLDLRTRSVRLEGGMIANPEAPRGDIRLTIGDLADLSAFLPSEAKGAIDGRIVLDGSGTAAEARIEAEARGVVTSGITISKARLNATIGDPFGTRTIEGQLTASDISAGTPIPSVALAAKGPADAAIVNLTAEAMGGRIAADGTLSATEMALALDRLDITRDALKVTLAEPARLTVADGAIATDGLTLTANGGRVTARGRAGSVLDLSLSFQKLPLSLANAFSPGLGLAGTLDGTATLTGAPATPNGRYDLSVAGLSGEQTRGFGLGAFTVKTDGTLANGRTALTATATGGGTNLRIEGSAPLGAGDLDLRATGRIDAGLLNTRLAATGERLAGTVSLDLAVRGSTNAPSVGGTARLAGGSFSSPGLGLNLTNMTAAVSGDGRALSLSAFSATTPGGGRLTGDGRVAVDPGAGFPGTLNLTAANAEVANTKIVKARADAQIRMEGPLAREPRIAGTITMRRMDITLPERLPAGAAAIQVEHRNAPPAVRRQLARQEAEEARASSGSAFNASLDLSVRAMNQIFLRGQGIEAELSGDLRIGGSTNAPQIDGMLETRRGTLSLLGQRLTFTRGIVTFPGDITPQLDLLAETRAGDVTAYIGVTGSASQPAFTLSSQPALPQDEVMARLLFNRATGELSPGQAIQIAQALASLSGGGPGALDSIRRGLGVDTLDVTTDESGGPALAVGRYINDNISIGARQGTTPESSRVTVDIDVTERIKIQGEAGADGNSKVGVGVEWEY